uniref:L1 transposable element RRM domain-containing protein n=1 Tax=Cyclopterus lumpus TaxID=8103 RepID=A0A8C3A0C1_CYCLU
TMITKSRNPTNAVTAHKPHSWMLCFELFLLKATDFMPGRPPKDDKKTYSETLLEEDTEQVASNKLTHDETSSNGRQILSAIQSMNDYFSIKLHEVISSNREIKEAVGAFSQRLTEAETRISTAEDQITSLAKQMENLQRRSNLRLVGLPEGAESGDAHTFLSGWLHKTLNIEAEEQQPVIVTQAYRLGRIPLQTQDQQGLDGIRPRTILVKFQTYRDRDRVMNAARLKDRIKVDGGRVMFFPDFSTEVQRQRKLFDGVKQSLRQMHLVYERNCEFNKKKPGTTSLPHLKTQPPPRYMQMNTATQIALSHYSVQN